MNSEHCDSIAVLPENYKNTIYRCALNHFFSNNQSGINITVSNCFQYNYVNLNILQYPESWIGGFIIIRIVCKIKMNLL
jgi:hypothetical protein